MARKIELSYRAIAIGAIAMVALIAAGALVAVFMRSGGLPVSGTVTTPAAAEAKARVISTCESAVRQSLKDPDSAKFGDDWTAWSITSGSQPEGMTYDINNGDRYWNASGSVNGKNSYGAYVGAESYYCDVVVSASGEIKARPRPVADVLSPP